MVTLSSKNLSKFTFNGGATRKNKVLQFTGRDYQQGSAFYFKPVTIKEDTSFETYFQFTAGMSGGVAFVLQSDPRKDNTLGLGSGLGTAGSSGITPSVRIDLNGYYNTVDIKGSQGTLKSVGANLDLDSNTIVNVWIDYNGKNDKLEVFTSGATTKPRNALLSSKFDVEGIAGNKTYIGFTGVADGINTSLTQWNFSTSDPSSGTGKTINGNNRNNRLKGTNKNEKIDGKGGKDILIGAAGNDTLVGGGGADDFVLGSGKAYKKNDLGIDTIKDFQPNVDDIILDTDTFVTLKSDLGEGFSIKREFASVKNKKAVAGSVADIVYDRSTGDLYYNPNSALSGFGGGGKIATLEGAPKISASDFVLE